LRSISPISSRNARRWGNDSNDISDDEDCPKRSSFDSANEVDEDEDEETNDETGILEDSLQVLTCLFDGMSPLSLSPLLLL
jgi:hypothetical protein